MKRRLTAPDEIDQCWQKRIKIDISSTPLQPHLSFAVCEGILLISVVYSIVLFLLLLEAEDIYRNQMQDLLDSVSGRGLRKTSNNERTSRIALRFSLLLLKSRAVISILCQLIIAAACDGDLDLTSR